MKIAVTYENGNVFQHFGHTEEFKVYDVEDGKILSGRWKSTASSCVPEPPAIPTRRWKPTCGES